eukprot:10295837-Prorocentrum_lima.AAC.1
MTSSLVGSEMCIRDRSIGIAVSTTLRTQWDSDRCRAAATNVVANLISTCLLYTSDAADDM